MKLLNWLCRCSAVKSPLRQRRIRNDATVGALVEMLGDIAPLKPDVARIVVVDPKTGRQIRSDAVIRNL